MQRLNPLEIAILNLLDGPLWALTDLEITLCPEIDPDELTRALKRLASEGLIEVWPGRLSGDSFYLLTDKGTLARTLQHQQQIDLFTEVTHVA